MNLLFWAIPVFQVTMIIEWWLMFRKKSKESTIQKVRGYILQDSAASISMGIGNLILGSLAKTVVMLIFFAVYQFRFFEIATDIWWSWVLLMLADDFCFYWYHRSSHQVRFFWAAHVTHHSSTHYNLSTALRQSWTSPFSAWLFWLPLPLLGFHPAMILVAQSISLLYQYWIHTELIERLGPLEWVFNTPSHHRVHHGSNHKYLDRNHGGILIIWDRIFGTFQQEQERPSYGLTINLESYNLFLIAFHEWRDISKDIVAAKTWRGRFLYAFGPPGWREDGIGRTASEMRRDASQYA